jgi:hypothetical protein
MILFLEVEECRDGKPVDFVFMGENVETYQPVRIFVGIGMEKNRIDDAENDGAGSDSQGECKDGKESEATILIEASDSVSEVAENAFDGSLPA